MGILLSLSFQTILFAQELTGAEVTELLNSAFMQNQAGKHLEALEGFLKVGQNTKKQRTEPERQVYVCSQTMAVMCYEQLKKYQEGFALSEQLLKEKLTDKEKEDILHLYVMNGYFMATSYIKSSNRRYEDARAILDKILPFADEDMRDRILLKIPLSWYFEGTVCQVLQQYEEALPCIEEAQKGFHELGETKNEIDAMMSGVTVEESDPTVPSWAKAPSKPTYTAQEVGALPSNTTIPSRTSQLTNDSGFLSQSDLSAYHTVEDFEDFYNHPFDALRDNVDNHIGNSSIHVTQANKDVWNGKQDALVSGENIKTVNGESLLGEGNITIHGAGVTFRQW